MILSETPGEISLHTRRNWLLIALAILLVGLSLVIGLGLAKRTTLSCSRVGAGVCEIGEDRLLSHRSVVLIPLRMLQGAEATPTPLNRHATYYRLNLKIDDGLGPYFFAWYGDREQAIAAASRIQEYLGTPGDLFLHIDRDRRPLFWTIAGVLGAMGLLVLLFGSQTLTARFDGQMVEIVQRNLLGRRARRYPTNSIRDLEVSGLRHDCLLFMVLHDGRRVPLGLSSDPDAFRGPRRVRQANQLTAERLRLSLKAEA